MCNIKLRLSEGDRNVELEMVDYNDDTLKFVMDKLSDVFSTTSVQENSEEENLKQGYQWYKSEEEGLHDPGSEFSLPTITQKDAEIKPLLENPQSEIRISGMKEDGRKQCWYICGHCNSKGKHFISSNRSFVTCHDCQHRMRVRYADPRGEGFQDEHGNYYIAGEYKKTLKDQEDEEQFWKEFQTS